ncbi:MAG: hypothetical protein WAL34_03935 [Acidobacteriaceae bacterium]
MTVNQALVQIMRGSAYMMIFSICSLLCMGFAVALYFFVAAFMGIVNG